MDESNNYEMELNILHSDLDEITKIKLIQQQYDIKKAADFINFQNNINALNLLRRAAPDNQKEYVIPDSTEILSDNSPFRSGNDLVAQALGKQA